MAEIIPAIQEFRAMCRGTPGIPDADWSPVPREFVIDLSAVSTRDQFMKALSPHFPVGPDHRDIWFPFYQAIIYQTCPFRIRFTGWESFAQRMPQYARKVLRLVHQYQRQHGEERLYVDYAA